MDKIPFTSHHVTAYFLPGFIFLMLFMFMWGDWSWIHLHEFITNNDEHIGICFLIIIGSYAAGLLLDTLRSAIVEPKANTLPLKRLMNAKEQGNLSVLYENYYTYYVFDINTSFSIGIVMIVGLIHTGCTFLNIAYFLFLLIFLLLLLRDAYLLHVEIKAFSDTAT